MVIPAPPSCIAAYLQLGCQDDRGYHKPCEGYLVSGGVDCDCILGAEARSDGATL